MLGNLISHVAGQIFGGPRQPEQTPGFHSNGFEQFLGSHAGKLASNIGMGAIGNIMGRRQTEWNFNRLKREGLTPWEIAGGGGTGGVQSAQGGNVLGSGPANAQTSQLKFMASENAKDRATELAKAQLAARAPGEQARVARDRLNMDIKMNNVQRQKVRADLNLVMAQSAMVHQELEAFWPKIYAQMGPENGLFALASFINGVSLENVLTGIGDPAMRAEAQKLYDDFIKVRSTVGKEALGFKEVLKQLLSAETNVRQKPNTLGRTSSQDTLELFKREGQHLWKWLNTPADYEKDRR